MTSTIDSLFDGDIRPAEDILAYSDELREMYAHSTKMLTEIRNSLPENQRNMIDEYADLKNRISEESARTGFRVGLSMGINLMSESFSYVEKLTEGTESDNQ